MFNNFVDLQAGHMYDNCHILLNNLTNYINNSDLFSDFC